MTSFRPAPIDIVQWSFLTSTPPQTQYSLDILGPFAEPIPSKSLSFIDTKSSWKMKPAFCAFLGSSLDAHGFVYSDYRYVGNVPNGDAPASFVKSATSAPSRAPPIRLLTVASAQCAQLATLMANPNPGSAMAFNWSGGDLELVRFSSVLVILDPC